MSDQNIESFQLGTKGNTFNQSTISRGLVLLKGSSCSAIHFPCRYLIVQVSGFP